MDAAQSTGSVTLREFFSIHGRPVRNLNDFWRWRADLIVDQLKDMLDELQDFIKEIRQNENGNQKEIAGKLSGPLKSFADKNGIKLENASLDDLAKLEKILQDKIIELLKKHAARAVDQTQDDKPDGTIPAGINEKEISLTQPDFQTKILQELLNPAKSIRYTKKDSPAYPESEIDLPESGIEFYA